MMSAHDSKRRSIGLFCGFASAFVFALMAFLVRVGNISMPSSQMLFGRGLLGVVVLGVLLRHELPGLFGRGAVMVWCRCLFGAGSVVLYYWNLKHTTVANATVLLDLAPAFVVAFGILIRRKLPRWSELSGVALAVSGAVVLYGVGASHGSLKYPHVVVGAAGACLAAFAYMSLKKAAAQYSSKAIVWAFSVTLLGLSVGQGVSEWEVPGYGSLLILTGAAGSGLIGQLLLTESFRHLEVSVAAAICLSSVVIGGVMESLYFGQWPTAGEWISYMMIQAGCYIVQRVHAKKVHGAPDYRQTERNLPSTVDDSRSVPNAST